MRDQRSVQAKLQHPWTGDESKISGELCAAVVERVCEAEELRRSARLRDFLRYVSQQVLENPTHTVTEQEIGVKIFNRPVDYDTGIDNIVRVNASELRKRLGVYFANEGAAEPVMFTIPRGSYTPRFALRAESYVSSDQEISEHETEPREAANSTEGLPRSNSAAHSGRGAGYVGWMTAAWVLAIACAVLGYDLRQAKVAPESWRNQPTLAGFWSKILDGPRATDVVLADTSFALAEEILGEHISLDHYLSRTYIADIESSKLPPELKGQLAILASRSNGSIGDFGVAQRILLLAPNSEKLKMTYARTLEPPAVKSDNLILIGSSYSNPWTSLFEPKLNFVVALNDSDKRMVVFNEKPISGEEPIYQTQPQTAESVGYSVIASIPSDDGKREVVIIEGTSAEATGAAGEFLTSAESMNRLAEVLQTRSLRHFEVLLRTTKLAGTPLSAQIVAWRVYR